MSRVQFFTQKMIDQWALEGKVHFDGKTLKVLVGTPAHYVLQPAVMVLDIVDGEDQRQLKGKVISEAHQKTLNMDVYLDSGIIGQVAYKVEPGFVVAGQASSVAEPAKDGQGSGDSLADIMLKTLSGL